MALWPYIPKIISLKKNKSQNNLRPMQITHLSYKHSSHEFNKSAYSHKHVITIYISYKSYKNQKLLIIKVQR